MNTQQHELPSVAARVLVPVANPTTAEGLLRLALSLVDEGGRVIAVYVTLLNAEPRPGVQEKLEAVIQKLTEEGGAVELVTDLATSIARGILDIAQERSADLIVLGIRGMQRGKVVLGPVVDAVARTAPCHVLVYRGLQPLYGGQGYQRVIVPVDGSSNSRLAARIGLRFARFINVPLTALYVQTESSMKRWQALGMIEASLEGLEDATDTRKIVVHARDVVSGILGRLTEQDLVILGFSEQSSLDRWLFGDIPQRLLSGVPGPFILVKQAVGESVPDRLGHLLSNLMPTLTPAEEAEVNQMAQEMSKPTTNFFVLVILSCLIAAIGLLQNSAAVIIGAMLIAPLMSPLMGFAVGLTQGHPRLMRTAAWSMLRGVLLTLMLSALVGGTSPLKDVTVEMLARGQPTLLDMGVALFSGAAGAYAMARKDIPSALAGVAIAAALMPPLCTVGLALAFGEATLASGAFLLFLTNIVSMTLAGAAVFRWLGMRLRAGADAPARYRQRVLISLVVLVILALPLAGTLRSASMQAVRFDAVSGTLQETFGNAVVNVQLQDGPPLHVVATVRLAEAPSAEDVAAVQDRLHDRLGEEVRLEVVVWQMVIPPEP